MRNGWIIVLLLLSCFSGAVKAQWDDDLLNDSLMGIIDTAKIRQYPFIHYGKNRYDFPSGNSYAFERFYSKFDSVINRRKGQVVIYHIGGSHIQADIYSNKMRTYLNSYWPGLLGARGLVFPFSLAETNNPYNYKAEGTGNWTAVRNVEKKDTSRLGLLGISIRTKDSISSIKIYYREKESMRYLHDQFRVYHNSNPAYKVHFAYPGLVKSTEVDSIAGYTQFNLYQEVDTAWFVIQRLHSDTGAFVCYGVEMMNEQPGIVYNSIGINGASFNSYKRCQDWEKQLSARKPDMFIISIGTNDANVLYNDFDSVGFYQRYEEMILKILHVNPDAAILLTVPNDAYYYRKYANKNVARMEQIIFALAEKYNMGVWDFYGIMGGYNSSHAWYKEGLMHKDRVHFTLEGYNLKGDLFFEAFLKYLNEFEYRRLIKLSNEK
ncbi:MAG TPA: GDSL-type esterase/lipase family protein [Flavobacteriales bacterium]|nr:GDSL-type esterase/lipase family protein [Flavobacteriales bacterium]